MQFLEIPLQPNGDAAFIQTVNVGGVYYKFGVHWNTRDEAWYLTIYDTDDTIIIGNSKLVTDYELISKHKVEGMPNILLFLFDMTGAGERATFESLGSRHKLMYLLR